MGGKFSFRLKGMTMSQILFFRTVTPPVINRQNEKFTSTPQKGKRLLRLGERKIAQISRNMRYDKCNAKNQFWKRN